MKTSMQFLGGLLVSAFMLAGLALDPAIAQEKGKAISKVLAENEKVRVLENSFKPGDVNESPPSANVRVVRVLKGGTLLRTYADGKTEKIEWKTGETKIMSPSTQSYTAKDVGKTDIVLYIVVLK